MTTLPSLYGSFLGFATIFICIGFGMLSLRNAAGGEVGPGYWSASFFLNSAGFWFWAGTIKYSPWLFFTTGEILHMLGFITLVYGAYRFTGKDIQRWNIYALCGIVATWVGAMTLMLQYRSGAFSLLMVLRAVLFLWAGRMILRHVPTKSLAGRRLAGGGLLAWGMYILLFPLLWRLPSLLPMAFGFLVGFHVLVALGMVVLVVDRMRLRAEDSEKRVQRLEGFLPICSHCKKIRDDHDHWHRIESYIKERSDVEFSHGMCPECSDELYGKEDWYIEMKKEEN